MKAGDFPSLVFALPRLSHLLSPRPQAQCAGVSQSGWSACLPQVNTIDEPPLFSSFPRPIHPFDFADSWRGCEAKFLLREHEYKYTKSQQIISQTQSVCHPKLIIQHGVIGPGMSKATDGYRTRKGSKGLQYEFPSHTSS
jgi:hypothetical protein